MFSCDFAAILVKLLFWACCSSFVELPGMLEVCCSSRCNNPHLTKGRLLMVDVLRAQAYLQICHISYRSRLVDSWWYIRINLILLYPYYLYSSLYMFVLMYIIYIYIYIYIYMCVCVFWMVHKPLVECWGLSVLEQCPACHPGTSTAQGAEAAHDSGIPRPSKYQSEVGILDISIIHIHRYIYIHIHIHVHIHTHTHV